MLTRKDSALISWSRWGFHFRWFAPYYIHMLVIEIWEVYYSFGWRQSVNVNGCPNYQWIGWIMCVWQMAPIKSFYLRTSYCLSWEPEFLFVSTISLVDCLWYAPFWLKDVYSIIILFSFSSPFVKRFSGLAEDFVCNYISLTSLPQHSISSMRRFLHDCVSGIEYVLKMCLLKE